MGKCVSIPAKSDKSVNFKVPPGSPPTPPNQQRRQDLPGSSSQRSVGCLPCTSSKKNFGNQPPSSSKKNVGCLPCTSSKRTLSDDQQTNAAQGNVNGQNSSQGNYTGNALQGSYFDIAKINADLRETRKLLFGDLIQFCPEPKKCTCAEDWMKNWELQHKQHASCECGMENCGCEYCECFPPEPLKPCPPEPCCCPPKPCCCPPKPCCCPPEPCCCPPKSCCSCSAEPTCNCQTEVCCSRATSAGRKSSKGKKKKGKSGERSKRDRKGGSGSNKKNTTEQTSPKSSKTGIFNCFGSNKEKKSTEQVSPKSSKAGIFNCFSSTEKDKDKATAEQTSPKSSKSRIFNCFVMDDINNNPVPEVAQPKPEKEKEKTILQELLTTPMFAPGNGNESLRSKTVGFMTKIPTDPCKPGSGRGKKGKKKFSQKASVGVGDSGVGAQQKKGSKPKNSRKGSAQDNCPPASPYYPPYGYNYYSQADSDSSSECSCCCDDCNDDFPCQFLQLMLSMNSTANYMNCEASNQAAYYKALLQKERAAAKCQQEAAADRAGNVTRLDVDCLQQIIAAQGTGVLCNKEVAITLKPFNPMCGTSENPLIDLKSLKLFANGQQKIVCCCGECEEEETCEEESSCSESEPEKPVMKDGCTETERRCCPKPPPVPPPCHCDENNKAIARADAIMPRCTLYTGGQCCPPLQCCPPPCLPPLQSCPNSGCATPVPLPHCLPTSPYCASPPTAGYCYSPPTGGYCYSPPGYNYTCYPCYQSPPVCFPYPFYPFPPCDENEDEDEDCAEIEELDDSEDMENNDEDDDDAGGRRRRTDAGMQSIFNGRNKGHMRHNMNQTASSAGMRHNMNQTASSVGMSYGRGKQSTNSGSSNGSKRNGDMASLDFLEGDSTRAHRGTRHVRYIPCPMGKRKKSRSRSKNKYEYDY